MIERSVKAKALVFAIFLLGIGSGLFISYIYTTRVAARADAAPNTNAPERTQRAQRDINKFYDYLGLNQQQRDQMHKIGEETRREFQDLRKETQPRYEAIQEASRVKIRAVLNDEQRQKYDDFRKRMDERRQAREKQLKDRNSNSDRGTK